MADTRLAFLKLGGSLITDKSGTAAARPETIARLAAEIQRTLTQDPGLRLLLGHGSGSFGHVPARKYGTRTGVSGPEGWYGFGQVWEQAAALNRLVVDALRKAGVNAFSFPPSAGATAAGGRLSEWDSTPIRAALSAGIVPVVFGDVVFDREIGGTIASTEDVFVFLAPQLRPGLVLNAGIEAGVWADFPACTRLVERLDRAAFDRIRSGLAGSAHVDVTGGMESKVLEMQALAELLPDAAVRIFGGTAPGTVEAALLGSPEGTRIAP